MATPLLVFADDWGRHPSSCQHLVRHLLTNHSTLWVNTIGTRTPRLDLATVKRVGGKIRQRFARNSYDREEQSPAALTVCNPHMWPWLSRTIDRRLNRALLVRQLRPRIEAMSEPPIAITTLPVVADLMGRLPVARWVYYCVDDFSEWPGLDRKAMSRMEAVVVAKADVIVSASENLQERIQKMGRESSLLTHGVDLEFWNAPGNAPPGIDELEGPLIVFWGVIDRRMDTEFVQQLAQSLTRGTIVLAGPEQNPDPILSRLPRTHRPGPMRFSALPGLAQQATVLVMPYVDQPVTRAMQPLKLKEYLAVGKPVVVRDLPANRDWAKALDLTSSASQFVQVVLQRLETGLPDEQRLARERLDKESWQSKADRFEQLIRSDPK